MTPEEAQGIIDGWIEEIVVAMPPHQKLLPEPACDAIMTEALVKRYERALGEGGRDKAAVISYAAYKEISEYLETKEPRGLYDPDAILCLDGNLCVEMAKASKENMQRWRDYMSLDPEHGCNYGNILYAEARLAIWGEEKTLGELEDRLTIPQSHE